MERLDERTLAIGGTFLACAALFVLLWLGRTVAAACQLVSLTHHVVVALIGFYACVVYRADLHYCALAPNRRFFWASVVQHVNIGYFLYDLMHALTWEHQFIIHHLIALSGFFSSEYSGVFALANAQNIWMAEIGSIFYNFYFIWKSRANYARFVALYTVTRVFFALWSAHVLVQVWRFWREGGDFPVWAPACAASLQLLLLGVNTNFLLVHWRKLQHQLKEK